MQYKLINSTKGDEERLVRYKLLTTISEDMDDKEKSKIILFVHNHIKEQIPGYKLIAVDDKVVGCVRVAKFEDGVILDELFIEEEFRHKGIGSSILKDILRENPIIYLWVYKTNTIARNLYLKLGFKVIKEEGMREFMKNER